MMMNPGPVEEVGKAAGTFMGIMKDNPLSLALVAMNLCLLALFFYIAKVATENRRTEFQILQDNQKEVNKLLFQCVPAGMKLQSGESHIVPLPPERPKE